MGNTSSSSCCLVPCVALVCWPVYGEAASCQPACGTTSCCPCSCQSLCSPVVCGPACCVPCPCQAACCVPVSCQPAVCQSPCPILICTPVTCGSLATASSQWPLMDMLHVLLPLRVEVDLEVSPALQIHLSHVLRRSMPSCLSLVCTPITCSTPTCC
ncbi:keratin-associated protein 12-3-like [Trichechus manatus latirostris]|uniref:Keratin-associated protein 12-3-like n=1 Tax=Trichechus manatus latirostris TaxID=127582 RepID=A0A2Y9FZS8_TRIMA|nr:keratin-associated protein 12-3-like [Trichechus manatus latirostris]